MSPFKKARRVWTRKTDEPNQYASFRSHFTLNSIPENLRLLIRADNRYAVWINGYYLPAQQYSDYDFYRVYDDVEIPKEYLHEGQNLLAVLAYCQNENSSTYRKGTPSVIYELRDGEQILTASGKDTRCCERTGFVCGPVEKISPQVSYSFRFAAEVAGTWMETWYIEDEAWRPAYLLPDGKESYYPRPIRQLKVGMPLPARICAQGVFKSSGGENTNGERVSGAWLRHIPFSNIARAGKELPSENGVDFAAKDGDGCYVLVDLLREQVGYVFLDFVVDEACNLDVGWGEHLEDLRVRASVGGRNFAFSYRAKAGRNRFFYPFKRLGGRYLQLLIGAHSFKLCYAGLLPVKYPLEARPAPEGLNPLQNRIYEVSLNTLRCCMHEHYEDTPWREQALYAMDSRNQMLFTYAAYGETDYAKASLRLLGLGLGEDNLLELCAPARVDTNIPSFCLVWIRALWEYYEQSGDSAFLVEMYPYMKSVLAFFEAWERNDLLYNPQGYWGFYEWAPFMDGVNEAQDRQITREGFDAPLNAFYVLALRAVALICATIGKPEEAERTEKRCARLKERYRQAFYDETKRAYRVSMTPECAQVYPQLVQALTICAGLCAGEAEEKALAARLLSGEFWPETSLSHRVYLYEAMLRDPGLYRAVLQDVDEKWGNMLFAGATSFWETAQGASDFGDAGSLCHGWSAVPIYVYYKIFGNRL